MRIAVFGAGGVGGYFGGRLAQAGQDVAFIARGDHLRALQTSGLQVESIAGDFQLPNVQASDDPTEVGPVDIVLVGVKAWQVAGAAVAMRPLLAEHTIVVPLQNGVEAPRQLAGVLGEEHVAGGLCRIIAYLQQPGHIRHAGIHPSIQFGALDNHAHPQLQALLQAFSSAPGVSAAIPDDIQAAMWRKFLLIVSWSGVGAITRAPLGGFLRLRQTRQLLRQVMEEVVAVAGASGIELTADDIENTMAFMDGLPEDGTASMQRDIMEGRPSELEAQNGAVVRLGKACSVPTPANAFIYHCLLPQERAARAALP